MSVLTLPWLKKMKIYTNHLALQAKFMPFLEIQSGVTLWTPLTWGLQRKAASFSTIRPHFRQLTLLTPLYTSIILGSSWGIGCPDTSDITVPTSVCFSVIFSMMMSAKVLLQGSGKIKNKKIIKTISVLEEKCNLAVSYPNTERWVKKIWLVLT